VFTVPLVSLSARYCLGLFFSFFVPPTRTGQQVGPAHPLVRSTDQRRGRVAELSISYVGVDRVSGMPPEASASASLDGSLVEKGRRASVAIDDAHLAADDIDELWQSVDAR
jgi:hypothetical protein